MALNPLGNDSNVKHRDRFPPIEPFNTGMLRVSELHQIYYEECGAREGIPVVYLHGGPGGNIEAKDRQLFDPKLYRIVLFEQRGCGRSLPMGETNENDTWHLVADIEQLQEHLKIDRWVVFGGSWGSTLAMTYAIKHIKAVRGLLIWGISFCSQAENDWLLGPDGTARILPDYYEEFTNMVPLKEREPGGLNVVEVYRKRVFGNDRAEAKRFADAWGLWEYRACKIQIPEKKKDEKEAVDGSDGDHAAKAAEADRSIAMSKMEMHYFKNEGFLHDNGKNYVLDNISTVSKAKIPVIAIQGRLDLVCPSTSAWRLKKAWPELDLRFVPDGVHSSSSPSMQNALLNATDELARRV